jgi:hypothetical protein
VCVIGLCVRNVSGLVDLKLTACSLVYDAAAFPIYYWMGFSMGRGAWISQGRGARSRLRVLAQKNT